MSAKLSETESLPSHKAGKTPPRGEVEQFLAANPDLESIEYLQADINGMFRGKWAPASSLAKVFKDGMPLPMSIFGLDVWGREVEETGLHIETGDKDGFCFPVPDSLKRVTWP